MTVHPTSYDTTDRHSSFLRSLLAIQSQGSGGNNRNDRCEFIAIDPSAVPSLPLPLSSSGDPSTLHKQQHQRSKKFSRRASVDAAVASSANAMAMTMRHHPVRRAMSFSGGSGTPSVSFSRNIDGSIKHEVASGASSTGTPSSPVLVSRLRSTPKYTKTCPPPPPPPRTSASSKNSNSSKLLSERFGRDVKIGLPFSNATKSSNKEADTMVPTPAEKETTVSMPSIPRKRQSMIEIEGSKHPSSRFQEFKDEPLDPRRRHSDGMEEEIAHQHYDRRLSSQTHRGYRRDYLLGQAARSPRHMLIPSTHEETFVAANALKNYDFAFVKRSDQSWSYAIVAYRSFEPVKGSTSTGVISSDELEECMMFVMCDRGSTKLIKKKQWGEFIRLVSMEDLDEEWIKRNEEEQQQQTNRATAVPADEEDSRAWVPSKIVFVPSSNDDEECSLISRVSVPKF